MRRWVALAIFSLLVIAGANGEKTLQGFMMAVLCYSTYRVVIDFHVIVALLGRNFRALRVGGRAYRTSLRDQGHKRIHETSRVYEKDE